MTPKRTPRIGAKKPTISPTARASHALSLTGEGFVPLAGLDSISAIKDIRERKEGGREGGRGGKEKNRGKEKEGKQREGDAEREKKGGGERKK